MHTLVTLIATCDAMESPAIVRDGKLRLEHANTAYLNAIGTAMPASVLKGIDIIDLQAFRLRREWGGDVVLELPYGMAAAWWETLPVLQAGKVVAAISILRQNADRLELDLARACEVAETPVDNLWIVSDQRLILAADTDSGTSIKGQAVGLPFLDLVHHLHRETFSRHMNMATQRAGEVVSGETVARRKDGMRRVGFHMQYRPAKFGGRWYMATRSRSPQGGQICGRLMLAYGVGTQRELAERLQISRSLISRYSKAEEVPPSWIVNCWKETGISTDWLLTGHGKPKTR